MLRTQAGFTYLGLLFMVAIMGAVLAATGTVWSTVQQREKERELLFVGSQFRKAIAQYYERSPGATKRFPKTLGDLLGDARYNSTQRYLRKIYVDPMTREAQWGTVPAPDGGIMGVYSLSNGTPLKTANHGPLNKEFEGAAKYADWKFVYVPPALRSQASSPLQPPQNAP